MNYKNLTLKEINIIFGQLYDLARCNGYLTGYRRSDQEYDVHESDGEIILRYAYHYENSFPVCAAKLK